MRHLPWKTLACLLLAMHLAARAEEPGPPSHPQLERELAAVVADPLHGMASLSVLAVRDGQVAYQQGFGRRYIDPRERARDKPARADTLYRIASVSKFVTMLGVMRLVEEGRLALDRDVAAYLGYPLRNPAHPERPITLRMLLSHTSSLRDEGGYSWGADLTLRSVLQDNPRSWDRRHPPGVHFTYSNLNWGVIATVMEAASQERFDRLMARLVLAPLGMRGSYDVAALAPVQRAQLATLYRKRGLDATAWEPNGPWIAQVDDYSERVPAPPPGLDRYAAGSNGTLFSPTGGLRASVQDLGKIMLMLLDGGRHEGRAFLSPATLAQIFSTQWRYAPERRNGDTYHGLFTHWGLGTQRFESAPGARDSLFEGGGYPAWGHLGEAWGLLSVFAINFSERSGVVVLIGGTARDPATTPGSYSALSRQEERVLSALQRHVLRVPLD